MEQALGRTSDGLRLGGRSGVAMLCYGADWRGEATPCSTTPTEPDCCLSLLPRQLLPVV